MLSIHIEMKSIFVRTTWTCLNHLYPQFNVICLDMVSKTDTCVTKCDSISIFFFFICHSVSECVCLFIWIVVISHTPTYTHLLNHLLARSLAQYDGRSNGSIIITSLNFTKRNVFFNERLNSIIRWPFSGPKINY